MKSSWQNDTELKYYDLISSDFHLFHWNINKFCNRGFSSVEEMNDTIINQLNETWSQNEQATFWHLGDLIFAKNLEEYELNIQRFLDKVQIPEHKFRLFLGNHDNKEILQKYFSQPIQFYNETGVFLKTENRFQKIVLCHYPFKSWNGKSKKYLNWFGHVHTIEHTENQCLQLDIGWDLHKKILRVDEAVILTYELYGKNPELYP